MQAFSPDASTSSQSQIGEQGIDESLEIIHQNFGTQYDPRTAKNTDDECENPSAYIAQKPSSPNQNQSETSTDMGYDWNEVLYILSSSYNKLCTNSERHSSLAWTIWNDVSNRVFIYGKRSLFISDSAISVFLRTIVIWLL